MRTLNVSPLKCRKWQRSASALDTENETNCSAPSTRMIRITSCVCTYVCILLRVAFFTLLERKGLRYIQLRKGPNKVGLAGIPQPLADAAKLLSKEIIYPTAANFIVFILAPVLRLFLAFILWQLYPSV